MMKIYTAIPNQMSTRWNLIFICMLFKAIFIGSNRNTNKNAFRVNYSGMLINNE